MRVLCPAKVNLHLRVGPRRDDGFHSLLTWMVTVGFFDKLEFECLRGVGAPGAAHVTLHCDHPDLPVNQDNLVLRAAGALQQACRRQVDGIAETGLDVSIRLEKRIPAGAGLGGGSSDAAQTLVALNQLCQLGLDHAALHRIAGSLGSDVPFFLDGPSAICRGRGEQVQSIAPPAPRWIVLMFPPEGLSTPAVYAAFDRLGLGDARVLENEPDWQHWTVLDSERLLPLLVNDLEPAAFSVQPELGKLRARIEQRIGRIVRMSGSGSTLFTVHDDAVRASRDAEAVQGAFPGVATAAVRLGAVLTDGPDGATG